MNQNYKTMHVLQERGVVWVTFDHGDINLLDIEMIREIEQLSDELEAEESCNVVVFQSSNPEFFIAHADVDLIRSLDDVVDKPQELNLYVAALERIRTLPMASIGKIAGIARGGGSEFLLSLDMRFAAIGSTMLSQPEVALGIFPTGSGSQRLPRLLGRAPVPLLQDARGARVGQAQRRLSAMTGPQPIFRERVLDARRGASEIVRLFLNETEET